MNAEKVFIACYERTCDMNERACILGVFTTRIQAATAIYADIEKHGTLYDFDMHKRDKEFEIMYMNDTFFDDDGNYYTIHEVTLNEPTTHW